MVHGKVKSKHWKRQCYEHKFIWKLSTIDRIIMEKVLSFFERAAHLSELKLSACFCHSRHCQHWALGNLWNGSLLVYFSLSRKTFQPFEHGAFWENSLLTFLMSQARVSPQCLHPPSPSPSPASRRRGMASSSSTTWPTPRTGTSTTSCVWRSSTSSK